MEGRFCQVEPLNLHVHCRSLYEANNHSIDDKLWTHLPYGPFSSYEDYMAWIEWAEQSRDPLFYAIVDRQLMRAVGVASYLRIEPEQGCIEVGHLCFSPLLQRKPAATEAMYLMMRYVFELGYRRYEWKCDVLNAASCAAARRLGFTFEGVFRQHRIVKGRNRDTAWFSVLDREWHFLKPAYERWLSPHNFDGEGRQKERLASIIAFFRDSMDIMGDET